MVPVGALKSGAHLAIWISISSGPRHLLAAHLRHVREVRRQMGSMRNFTAPRSNSILITEFYLANVESGQLRRISKATRRGTVSLHREQERIRESFLR